MSSRLHIQSFPGRVEGGAVGTHEESNVTVLGGGHDHFDTGSSGIRGGDLDLVQVSEHAVAVGGCAEQFDSSIGVTGVVGEPARPFGNDDCNADLLGASVDEGHREGRGCIGGDKLSVYFHVDSSERVRGVIDLSPLGSRRVVERPEIEAA